MTADALRYERIGVDYASKRRADPRIATAIHAALGDARTVLNVGAGTGNYEPNDGRVVALEPSQVMIDQRTSVAPVVRAVAEAMPFADGSFDAAMGVLTVHHWTDRARGLAEMRRVAERQVIFFFEPAMTDDAWIMAYWPEILDLPTEKDPPGEPYFRAHLDVHAVIPVLVPTDCTDGFGGAFWSRPEAYLDAGIQRGMSCFAQLASEHTARGMERLRAELTNGEWDRKYGHLRRLAEYDVGYRIVVAGRRSARRSPDGVEQINSRSTDHDY